MSEATFTDRHGTVWDTTLTLVGAKRIDASDYSELYDGEVNMVEPSQELLQDLLVNRPLVAALVYTICKKQADELELDQEGFIDRLDGTALEAACTALWSTLADFFPQAKTALSELQRLRTHMIERANTGLAKITKTTEAKLTAAVDEALIDAANKLESV